MSAPATKSPKRRVRVGPVKRPRLLKGALRDIEECHLPALMRAGTLHDAVAALQNNKVLKTVESKAGTSIDVTYPPELLKTLRAMFPAGRTYDFQLHGNLTVASVGGGVLQGYFAWNALSGYGEWSALAALFDEVKLTHSQLTWTTAFGGSSTGIIVQMAIAPDFVTNSVTPSFTPITRLAESEEFGIEVPGRQGSATAKFFCTVPRERQYALTSSPVSATLDCGMNGQWSFASNIVTTASINVAFVVVRSVCRFRNRA